MGPGMLHQLDSTSTICSSLRQIEFCSAYLSARPVRCARNTTELNSDDGAVFFMNPDNPKAPNQTAVVAQLTIKTGEDLYAAVSLQGRSKTGPDWHAESVIFSNDHADECQEALQAVCGDAKAVSSQACLLCCGQHELEAKAANCSAAALGKFCKPTQ